MQLPIFPDELTHITAEIAFQRNAGKVYYFKGHLPVFVHEERDLATFRMFTSQLAINGDATQLGYVEQAAHKVTHAAINVVCERLETLGFLAL